MAHLEDKLAEFFYGELSPSEMIEARRHVDQCGECRLAIEQFERTHLALKAMPEAEPPRHVVFSFPQHRAWLSWFNWPSMAAASATAAIVAAVIIRLAPLPGPTPASVPTPTPTVVQAERVDYDKIIREVRQSERVWLASELEKRDREIQRLHGELAYYENFQRAVMKETFENGSAIQLLAQRTDSR
jgi:negative regulator of sigma E activity